MPAVVVGPRHPCLGGVLAHAIIEPKEVIAVEPSGPDLAPAPWSHRHRAITGGEAHRRSAPKEPIVGAKGSSHPMGRLNEEGLLGADMLGAEHDGEGLLSADLLGASRAGAKLDGEGLLGVDLLDADCLPACCIALMPDAVVCLLLNRDWYREEIRERCYMGRDKRHVPPLPMEKDERESCCHGKI
jgi:hypothetical protein